MWALRVSQTVTAKGSLGHIKGRLKREHGGLGRGTGGQRALKHLPRTRNWSPRSVGTSLQQPCKPDTIILVLQIRKQTQRVCGSEAAQLASASARSKPSQFSAKPRLPLACPGGTDAEGKTFPPLVSPFLYASGCQLRVHTSVTCGALKNA